MPRLAVMVRRLHDAGHSGWMLLISLIPFIGGIILLVFLLSPSVEAENKYGHNPKTILDDNYLSSENAHADNAAGESIILAVVVWMLISRLIYFTISKLAPDLYSTSFFKLFNIFSTLVWGFIPIGLAFAVKDKSKRTILFVLGGILLLLSIIELATRNWF